MKMETFEHADLKSKRVILRADLNLPVHNGKIQNLGRVKVLQDTINSLKKSGAKIVIVTHFGRPQGKRNKDYSIDFLQPLLEKMYKTKVHFCGDIKSAKAEEQSKALPDGEIMLCENIRFYPGEEVNDENFAKEIARLGDVYVNDAFSCSHRAHASIVGVTHFLPAYAGLGLAKELSYLKKTMDKTLSPKMLIIGGFKVSTKLGVIERLAETMDCVAIGGAMANTFLQAIGKNMGYSYVESPFVKQAANFYETHKDKIILPVDLVCEVNGHVETFDVDSLPAEAKAFDVGPKTVKLFSKYASESKLVLWNAPLGFYENDKFAKGSAYLARTLSDLTESGQIQSIIGGGDTIASIEKAGISKPHFTYMSTSGGAFLEWLEGADLPGVKALDEKKSSGKK